MSILPICLDVTVLCFQNWKSWHLGLMCWTVVCKRHALVQLSWGIFITQVFESSYIGWVLSRTWMYGHNWKLWNPWRIFTFVESDMSKQHGTSLEGGRMLLQLTHLEGKKLLVVIQNTLLSCTRVVGIEAVLKLEAWGLEVWSWWSLQ